MMSIRKIVDSSRQHHSPEVKYYNNESSQFEPPKIKPINNSVIRKRTIDSNTSILRSTQTQQRKDFNHSRDINTDLCILNPHICCDDTTNFTLKNTIQPEVQRTISVNEYNSILKRSNVNKRKIPIRNWFDNSQCKTMSQFNSATSNSERRKIALL